MPKPVLAKSALAIAKPKAPTPKKPDPTFAERLALIDRAGYGVIVTRTREPVRVISALKHYTFLRKNPKTNELDSRFCVWDCLRGWVHNPVEISYVEGAVSLNEKDPTVISDATDVTAALALIEDAKNPGDAQKPWPTGLYVFNYPHFHIANNAEFIVMLKGYCHTLPAGRSRIVLVVPDGFRMPAELEDDITILDFTVPNQAELTARYHALLEELGKENPYSEADIDSITSAGLGMTELDFDQSLALAITETAGGDTSLPITAPTEDFLSIIYRCKTEAVKRTNILSLVDPLPIEDIGGMENLKAWCMERHNWLTPAARDFGLKAPRGALVVGVQGTGKSLIPRGIASIFRLPCVKLDIGKIFGQYVGQSEGNMDTVLQFILAIAPVVVHVDEIDKAGMGTDSANESSDRVKSKLLQFMQDAPDGIFWVCSANRTDKIPAELIRPGRCDITFGVILPKPIEREQVFKIHLRKRKQPCPSALFLAIKASEGYTPAEIEGAVNNATGECFTKGVDMTDALLAKHVKFIKPQSISHKADMDKIIEWCTANAIPASAQDAEKEDRAIAGPNKAGKRVLGG